MESSNAENFKVVLPEEGNHPLFIAEGLILFLTVIAIDNNYFDVPIIAPYIPIMIMTGFISRSFLGIAVFSILMTCSVYVNSTAELLPYELILFRWLGLFSAGAVVLILLRKVQGERQTIVSLISTLAQSLDARDRRTYYHSHNVARYSSLIGQAMGLPKKEIPMLFIGGLLHDFGKIGIPEDIINKPGRLTEDELEKIKKHPKIGYEILKHIPYFQKNGILNMVLYHHERFDGGGYPRGLQGEAIPLAARIMAVADTFDAMTSRRAYRDSRGLDDAVDEIRRNIGKQFDPKVAQVFLELVAAGKVGLPEDKNRHPVVGVT